MKSNKNFFGEKWISLLYGSYESPLIKTSLEKILVLGDVMMTSYGMMKFLRAGRFYYCKLNKFP
jgi:hypothetical protein